MKNTIIKKLAALAVAGLLGAIGLENQALGQGCCLTFPSNTVLTAYITVYPNIQFPSSGDPNRVLTTPAAWFAVDVTDPSAPIPPGVYGAFCVDESHFLPATQGAIPGTQYSGTLISTCDSNELVNIPNHTVVGPPPIVTAETWHQVNYLLNHKTGFYWWNVQVAINRLVGGYAPNDPLNPNPPAGNYPTVDITEVDALVGAATNNAAKWTNSCGGTVGVIFAIPDPDVQPAPPAEPLYQFIILEVPCVCVPPGRGGNCETIDAVQGVPIKPVTVQGSGGCGGPYTFSATGLPAGLTMSTSGTISGTPTATGPFIYTTTVTDACANTGSFDCSVIVQCSGQIGDFIWNDLNGNGCQDPGEPGISNVLVQLYRGPCGSQGIPAGSTLTDSTGHYLFVNLCPGNYQVAITTPAGYSATIPTNGCANANLPADRNQTDSKCVCGGTSPCTTCVTLTDANPSNLNVDCGYVCNGQIGDFIWNDLNSDGCQTPGEPGISNVLVILYSGTCGTPGTLIASNRTDSTGHYLFSGLCPGNYQVAIYTPAGFIPTVPTQGCTNNLSPDRNQLDSKCDCDGASPCINCVTLTAGNLINLNVDCGYIPARPDFKLYKSADKNFVLPGGTVTYTYVVTNTGSIAITNITVTDDNGTPAFTNDDFVVGTIANLPPGGSTNFTSTVLLPQTLCEMINGTNTTVGTLTTTVLPGGDIQVTLVQSLVNDNRYGTNATGWAGGHKFTDLRDSDKAEFRFTDSKGNVVLDGFVDYISAASSNKFPSSTVVYPSGYGTLGVTGGDGSIVTGAASNFLFCTTSFTLDMNNPVFASKSYQTNSPKETGPLSGTSIPAGWDYNDSFTVIVSKKAFGANGFGGVTIPQIHNSPAKLGSNMFTPTNCNNCVVNVALARGTAIDGTTLTRMDDAMVCIGTPPPCNALAPCTPPYPFASTNVKTSIAFNEPECLVTNVIKTVSNCVPTQVQIFYNDEHAMTLGVRQLITKKKVGTVVTSTTNNYAITPLSTNPGGVTNPLVGATAAQGGVDVSGRPIFPAMFVTDVTGNPANPYAGDWQYGGVAQPPNAVFGTWKGAVATLDQSVTPNTFAVNPDLPDPAKNNLNLGPGGDPFVLPGTLKDQGFTAEMRWDITSLVDEKGLPLQSGHTYRLYFMVHDGDQNKVGGDVGQDCGFITIPANP